ncbi:2-dehydro-3-deoxyphosphogluconate aldolase/(4S)-4-hydroxy-2-oxoglutarate aldolase [Mobilisporobacter senegalensis]|uniref:2-dehydro-3-deoxyphosphogluconate aldolase/(4S)-4-hydroxy-2-oxoglutarate aldolase n=1 Tax=Mobilisporobacter senegalensis TaxID=1329262 RepID=A0A3N1XKX3_9FIRM|nr:bifunctional 4-hydroxy-2-oxoglutarate aldolase/2-dehydro-3-deoxy-phosphogluconate aldolase [Mobilisporobacter senegalensis]ROR27360.1 2-dehydro-3-deoxyphosphogluconate aldolase/(4S)-4-hydroxy-2-oxoglutarate aldolase [Mobilisporobacter senegalensis]
MDIKNFPKVTVILRGYTYSQVRTVVKNLVGTKLQAVEITMNSPDAVSTIEKISREFGGFIKVGAGTVMTYEQAKTVIEAGAAFILSPTMLNKDILNLCNEHEIISVPGAFSPTEIKQSFDDGASIVKIFPAGRLGSQYITDIQAPLGKLPLMVVGGINTENVQEYFNGGASFAGIASGIFDKEDILNENEDGIIKSIIDMEAKLV